MHNIFDIPKEPLKFTPSSTTPMYEQDLKDAINKRQNLYLLSEEALRKLDEETVNIEFNERN